MPSVTPLGAEFRINDWTGGEQQTFAESRQAVAMDADGDWVAVWASLGQDGSGWGIFAQRYNAAGIAQGAEFQVNSTTEGDQLFPAVDMDDDGDFVIVWSGNGPGDASGVFAQRFDALGTAQGGEILVNTTTAGVQEHASVAVASNGNFVVVWSGNGPDDADGIFGQRFMTNGMALGFELRINQTTSLAQELPSVAMDKPGNFVVTWSSFGQDGDGWGVYGQRFNASGTTQGSEVLVNTTTEGDQHFSSVARNDAGIVISWTGDSDPSSGVDQDVYAQRYTNSGTALGSEIRVNANTGGDQGSPSVAVDAIGNFVVTWTSGGQDGDGLGVYGRRADGAGTHLGAEFLVNSTVTGAQRYSSVAVGENGDIVIVWSGNGLGDLAGVFGQRFGTGPGIVVAPVAGLTTGEDGTTAAFDVVLTSAPLFTVTIGLSSSDPTEGGVAPSSLVFTPDDWFVPQTVTVTGINDLTADGDVSYFVITAAAVSFDVGYDGLDPADVSLTNADDDAAGILVTQGGGATGVSEGGAGDSYTVVLTSQPTADVVITLDPGSQLGTAPATLTFTSGNWDQPQTVTVTAVGDWVVEGDHTGLIRHAVVSADGGYDSIAIGDVTVTIADNDAAGLTITGDPLNVAEAGAADTFAVALNSQPTADVIITLTPDGQLGAAPASLTFTSGNWNVPQVVAVTAVNDDLVEGPHSGAIALSVTSSDSSYDGLAPGGVTALIADDDSAGITVTPEGGLGTTEAGGTAVFSVVLTSQPLADVIVPLSSSNLAEGTVSPASLTFSPDDWNVPQAVTITGVDDAMADGSVAYAIVADPALSADPSYAGRDAADVAVTNLDDDVAGFSVNPTSELVIAGPGGWATFSVALRSQPRETVVVGLASSEPSETTLSATALTFTPANWNVAQDVTVTLNAEYEPAGSFDFNVLLDPVVSADPGYSGIAPAAVIISYNAPPPEEAGASPTAVSIIDTLEDNQPDVAADPSESPGPAVGSATNGEEESAAEDTPAHETGQGGAAGGPAAEAAAPAVAPDAPPAEPAEAKATITPPAVPFANSPGPARITPTSPVSLPIFVAAPVLWNELDRLTEQVRSGRSELEAQIAGTVTVGLVLYVGYHVLTSRAALWLALALAARPVWKRFDLVDVVFAWEEEKQRRRARGTLPDESLQSIVDRK